MRRSSRRGRSGWLNIPARSRLLISVFALAAIVLAVILIVRGCSVPDAKTAQIPVETAQPENLSGTDDQPLSEDADATPATGQEPIEADPLAEGANVIDYALRDVTDEAVDLEGDLAKAETSVPVGNRTAVIRSIGDIVGHIPILKSAYNQADKSYDFTPIFANIKASMGNADYTVINVDGPLGGKKFASYRGYPQFNTPPQILLALKDAGVDMLTLANNHALDTYFDGMLGTIKNVEKAGLDHVGAYASQEDHDTPKVVDINGIKVGFVNYTTTTNGMQKKSDRAATDYGLRMTNNSDAPKDIQDLKAAGAEIVVVYMHWGEEYTRDITTQIKKIANTLVGAGADVVVGGHQHVVLPCQWVKAKGTDGVQRTGLVEFGMGNFLSDQRARYRDSGIIFEFTLSDNAETGKVEVVSPKYIPTYVQRTQDANNYTYTIWPCGEVIADRPAGMPDDVFKRIKQVWNEQKEIMTGGPAAAAKS